MVIRNGALGLRPCPCGGASAFRAQRSRKRTAGT